MKKTGLVLGSILTGLVIYAIGVTLSNLIFGEDSALGIVLGLGSIALGVIGGVEIYSKLKKKYLKSKLEGK